MKSGVCKDEKKLIPLQNISKTIKTEPIYNKV